MIDKLQSWLKPTSSDPEIAQRQYILNAVLVGIAAPAFIFGLVMLILWITGVIPIAMGIGAFIALPFFYISYWLARREYITVAAIIPVSLLYLLMVVFLYILGVGHVSTVGFAIVITIASSLISGPVAAVFIAMSVIAYALTGYAQNAGLLPNAIPPAATVLIDSIGLVLALSVILILNWFASREITKALREERTIAGALEVRRVELENEVSKRTKSLERRAVQLETTADIAKLTAELTDPDLLMSQAVELIRERFGFYHASIFLMEDTGTWAELAASTGDAGRKMLARRHRLAIGSASVIGWVTANRLPRVSSEVVGDPYHFKNPLLPDTRSEAAVPLIVGQRLLGALDVQSTDADAFAEADVRTLEAIAGELAIAMDSARIQREMRQELDRSEAAFLDQIQGSWERLIRSGIPAVIHLNEAGEMVPPSDEVIPIIEEARVQGTTIMDEQGKEIAVPIEVRGEPVATIAARRTSSEDPWSEEEIAVIHAVAGQAALALENARQRAEELRRVQELEVINRVSQAVSQMLRQDTLFRVVHRQINQVIGDTDLSIALYDEESNMVEVPYSSERGEPMTYPPGLLGGDLTSVVIRSRQPLLLVEGGQEQAAMLGATGNVGEAKSWLGVPMLLGDDILGVITVQDFEREHRYSEDDAALLTTIASQVAAGIQNARLLDQVQRSARRERLIHEITSKIRRSPDMQTILETTSREVGRALNAARATIRLGTEGAPIKTAGTDPDFEPSNLNDHERES